MGGASDEFPLLSALGLYAADIRGDGAFILLSSSILLRPAMCLSSLWTALQRLPHPATIDQLSSAATPESG
jgi:hypothetical protein